MKPLLAKFDHNILAAGLQELETTASPAVQLDVTGVPVAWRLFSYGRFSLTRDGLTVGGEFEPEHAAAIVAYFLQKGVRVPIDSEHFLYRLAQNLGVSETEALATIPDGKVAMGYGDLEQRADGLWISNIEWGPFARQLMGELVYRYFSPVFRGLVDGRLRITSIGMIEIPATDNQVDVMAAGAESGDQGGKVPLYAMQTGAAAMRPPNGKGAGMNKTLLALLGAIVGIDALALGADGEAPAELIGKLDTLKTELPKLRQEATLARQLRDALALGAETEPSAVTGKLQGILQKAAGHDALKERVDALALAAETDKCTKLIETGVKAGKLTPDLVEKWAKKQDSVALGAFLDVAPVIVAPGATVDAAALRDRQGATLTPETSRMLAMLGIVGEEAQQAAIKR